MTEKRKGSRRLSPTGDGVLVVAAVANYHQLPFGGWRVAPVVDGMDAREMRTTTAHDAFHEIINTLDEVTQQTGTGFSTMHTLDYDPTAWAELAEREGFADCAHAHNSAPETQRFT